MSSADIKAFRNALRSSRRIIAVAGAGLSAASGIPTFRGAGGLWRKYDAMKLATPEAFHESPSLVWQFYHYRRETALRAQPNSAHYALAALSIPSVLKRLAPEATFHLITQNVDNLSPRANQQLAALFPDEQIPRDALYEMHGRLFDVLCSNEACKYSEFTLASPICPALQGTELLVDQGALDADIPVDNLPRCSKCGSLARPGVVWFGEGIPLLETLDALVEEADLCIVVGTSSEVYPAAGFAAQVQDHGGKVAVFNIDSTQGDTDADFIFTGPCEDLLPRALDVEILL